jgi:uncharacterized protein (DUF1800 family)
MSDRTKLAWLARRIGFGLAPGQLDALERAGVDATLASWIDAPAGSGQDPWAGLSLPPGPLKGKKIGSAARDTIGAWLKAMATTDQPFEEWMRWFWHGHFVSTVRVVHSPALLVDQLRLFGALGLGDFRSLLRAITTDPAMLIYLDGRTNKAGQINENYGREVLELFSLGVGNYTEHDVRAGSTALTGWVAPYAAGRSYFRPERHDDTPQQYLGHTDVHDVDTVVDTIVSHPACAPFIAGKVARAVLGPQVDTGLVARWGREFAASGLQIRPLVRSIVEAGLDGASTPLVRAPVPWSIAMLRASGVGWDEAATTVGRVLVEAGQVPLDAPNVGGWPGGPLWLTSSVTLARFDLAASLATRTSTGSPAGAAAQKGDLSALADALGQPEGFGPATTAALHGLPSTGNRPGDGRLAVAIASPDLAVA